MIIKKQTEFHLSISDVQIAVKHLIERSNPELMGKVNQSDIMIDGISMSNTDRCVISLIVED